MSTMKKLVIALIPAVILLIITYTIGAPYPETRETIELLLKVYLVYGLAFTAYIRFIDKKKS